MVWSNLVLLVVVGVGKPKPIKALIFNVLGLIGRPKRSLVHKAKQPKIGNFVTINTSINISKFLLRPMIVSLVPVGLIVLVPQKAIGFFTSSLNLNMKPSVKLVNANLLPLSSKLTINGLVLKALSLKLPVLLAYDALVILVWLKHIYNILLLLLLLTYPGLFLGLWMKNTVLFLAFLLSLLFLILLNIRMTNRVWSMVNG